MRVEGMLPRNPPFAGVWASEPAGRLPYSGPHSSPKVKVEGVFKIATITRRGWAPGGPASREQRIGTSGGADSRTRASQASEVWRVAGAPAGLMPGAPGPLTPGPPLSSRGAAPGRWGAWAGLAAARCGRGHRRRAWRRTGRAGAALVRGAVGALLEIARGQRQRAQGCGKKSGFHGFSP